MMAACAVYAGMLAACAFLDVKKREVPLLLQGAAFAVILAGIILGGEPLGPRVLLGASAFGIMLIGVLFFGLGGGDAIAGGLFGLSLGVCGIAALALSFLLTIPMHAFRLAKGRGREEYAFFPFLFAGYATVLALVAAGVL